MSARRNTTPLLGAAGRNVICAFRPLCRTYAANCDSAAQGSLPDKLLPDGITHKLPNYRHFSNKATRASTPLSHRLLLPETHEPVHGALFRSERRVIGAQWLTNSRKKEAMTKLRQAPTEAFVRPPPRGSVGAGTARIEPGWRLQRGGGRTKGEEESELVAGRSLRIRADCRETH